MRQNTKEQVRELICSDAVSKDLNIAHQNRHLRDSGGYIEGRSYLFDDVDPEILIQQYHGTGEIRLSRAGNWICKEFVTLDRNIGIHIGDDANIRTITNSFAIHYSKRGAHIVPSRPRR